MTFKNYQFITTTTTTTTADPKQFIVDCKPFISEIESNANQCSFAPFSCSNILVLTGVPKSNMEIRTNRNPNSSLSNFHNSYRYLF
jgi:hypothetical protein